MPEKIPGSFKDIATPAAGITVSPYQKAIDDKIKALKQVPFASASNKTPYQEAINKATSISHISLGKNTTGVDVPEILKAKFSIDNSTEIKDEAYIDGETKKNLKLAHVNGTDYIKTDNGDYYRYTSKETSFNPLKIFDDFSDFKKNDKGVYEGWEKVNVPDKYNDDIFNAVNKLKSVPEGTSVTDDKGNEYKKTSEGILKYKNKSYIAEGKNDPNNWEKIDTPSIYEQSVYNNKGLLDIKGSDYDKYWKTQLHGSEDNYNNTVKERTTSFQNSTRPTLKDIVTTNTNLPKSEIRSTVMDNYLSDNANIVQSLFPMATVKDKVEYSDMLDYLKTMGDSVTAHGTSDLSLGLIKQQLKRYGNALLANTNPDDASFVDLNKLKYQITQFTADYKNSVAGQNLLIDKKNGTLDKANHAIDIKNEYNRQGFQVEKLVNDLKINKKQLDKFVNIINNTTEPNKRNELVAQYQTAFRNQQTKAEYAKKLESLLVKPSEDETNALKEIVDNQNYLSEAYYDAKRRFWDYTPERSQLLWEKEQHLKEETARFDSLSKNFLTHPLEASEKTFDITKEMGKEVFNSMIGNFANIPGSLITIANNYTKDKNSVTAGDLIGSYFMHTSERMEEINPGSYDGQYSQDPSMGMKLFKSAGQSLGFMIPLVVGSLLAPEAEAGLIAEGGAIGRAAMAKTAISKISQFAIAHTEVFSDYYKKGKEQGLTDTQATNFGNLSASINSALELFMPTERLFKVNAELNKSLAKAFLTGDRSYLNATILNAIKVGAGETFEEFSQNFADHTIERLYNGQNLTNFETSDTVSEILGGGKGQKWYDTVASTFLTTLLMGIPGMKQAHTISKNKEIVLANDYNAFKTTLNELYTAGKIDFDKYIEANDHIQSYKVITDIYSGKKLSTIVEELNNLHKKGTITSEEKKAYLLRTYEFAGFLDNEVYKNKEGKRNSDDEIKKQLDDKSDLAARFRTYRSETPNTLNEEETNLFHVFQAEELSKFRNIFQYNTKLATDPTYRLFLKEIGVDINKKDLTFQEIKSKAKEFLNTKNKEVTEPIVEEEKKVIKKIEDDIKYTAENLKDLEEQKTQLEKEHKIALHTEAENLPEIEKKLEEITLKLEDVRKKVPTTETLITTEVPNDISSQAQPDNLIINNQPVSFKSIKGKEVEYRGHTGILMISEGGAVSIENENSIFEIPDVNEESDINLTGVKEIKNEVTSEIIPETKTSNNKVVSENEILLNGMLYEIHTNKLGNIIGLTPSNNLTQTITNEKLLILAEIERNKYVFNQIDNESTEIQDIIEEELNKIEETKLIQTIYEFNLTDNVSEGLNLLYNNGNADKLTESQKLQIELWVFDALDKIDDLVKEHPKNQYYREAFENLYIINKLLHNEQSKKTNLTKTVNKQSSEEKTKRNIKKESIQPTKGKIEQKVEFNISEVKPIIEDQKQEILLIDTITPKIPVSTPVQNDVETKKPEVKKEKSFSEPSIEDVVSDNQDYERLEEPHDLVNTEEENRRDIIKTSEGKYIYLNNDGTLSNDEYKGDVSLLLLTRNNNIDGKTPSSSPHEFVNNGIIRLKFTNYTSQRNKDQRQEFDRLLRIHLMNNNNQLDDVLTFKVPSEKNSITSKNKSIIETKRGEPNQEGWYSGLGINWLIQHNFLIANNTKLKMLIQSPGEVLIGVRKFTDKDVLVEVEVGSEGNKIKETLEFERHLYIELRVNPETKSFEYRELNVEQLDEKKYNKLFNDGGQIGGVEAFKLNNQLITNLYNTVENNDKPKNNLIHGINLGVFTGTNYDFYKSDNESVPLSVIKNNGVIPEEFLFTDKAGNKGLFIMSNGKDSKGAISKVKDVSTLGLKNTIDKPFTIFTHGVNNKGNEELIPIPAVLKTLNNFEFQMFLSKIKNTFNGNEEQTKALVKELKEMINLYNKGYNLFIEAAPNNEKWFVSIKIQKRGTTEEWHIEKLLRGENVNSEMTIDEFLAKVNEIVPDAKFNSNNMKASLTKDSYTDEELMEKLTPIYQYPYYRVNVGINKKISPKVIEAVIPKEEPKIVDETPKKSDSEESDEPDIYGAFKLSENNQANDNGITIEELNDILKDIPNTITRELRDLGSVNDHKILGQVIGSALFLDKLAPKSVAYHEKFHVVFRNLLTDTQIQYSLNLGRKELLKRNPNALSKENIDKFKKTRNYKVSNKQAEELIIEEYLADDYSDYTVGKASSTVRPVSIWQKIANFFKSIVNYFKKSNTQLYDKINNGYFKESTIKNNQFTNIGMPVYALLEGLDKDNFNAEDDTKTLLSNINAYVLEAVYSNVKLKYSLLQDSDSIIIERGLNSLISEATQKVINDNKIENLNTQELLALQQTNVSKYNEFVLKLQKNIDALENPNNEAIIKEYVLEKTRNIGVNLEDQEITIAEEEEGYRNFDQAIDEKGSAFNSLSQEIKLFLNSIVVKKVNPLGITITSNLNGNNIYNQLLHLTGKIAKDNLIENLYLSKDSEIKAVLQALEARTGFSLQNKDLFDSYNKESDISLLEGVMFYNRFIQVLDKIKVNHQTIREKYEDVKGKSVSKTTLIDTNRSNIDDVIYTRWRENFISNDLTQGELDSIAYQFSGSRFNFNQSDLSKKEKDLIKVSLLKLGIFVHSDLIDYIYSPNSIGGYVKPTKEDLAKVLSYCNQSVFFENTGDGVNSRIKKLAEGNSYFTNSAHEISFKSADNKTKYPYLYPNFIFTKSLDLNRDYGITKDWRNEKITDEEQKIFDNIAKLQSNSYYSKNFIINRDAKTVAKILGNLSATISGDLSLKLKDFGITLKDSDQKTVRLYQLMLFNFAKLKFGEENGANTVKMASFKNFQLEASSTDYTFELPVDELYKDGKLTQEAITNIYNVVEQEALRINEKLHYDLKTGEVSEKSTDDTVTLQSVAKQPGFAVFGFLNDLFEKNNWADIKKNKKGVITEFKLKVDITDPSIKSIVEKAILEHLNKELNTYNSLLVKDEIIYSDFTSKYFKIEGQNKKDFFGNYFFNSTLNNIAMEQLMIGDHSLNKDAIDYAKRLKSANAYGESYRGLFPRIMFTSEAEFEDSLSKRKNNTDDAQTTITLSHAFNKRLKAGRISSLKEFNDWKKLLEGFKSDSEYKKFMKDCSLDLLDASKTIYYDGVKMIKTSESVLTINYTSRWNGNEWVAKKGREYLHNKRIFMEKHGIDMSIAMSASKRITPPNAPQYNWEQFESDDLMKLSEKEVPNFTLDGQHYRLQVETKSHGYGRVALPVQLNNLIDTELPNDDKDVIRLRTQLQTSKQAIINENFKNAMYQFTKQIDKEHKFKDIRLFLEKVRDMVLDVNARPDFKEFLKISENGDFQFDANLPQLVAKFAEFYTNHFATGNHFDMLGRGLVLVSGLGYELRTKDGRIVTDEEYDANPDEEYDEKTRKLKIHTSNKGEFTYAEIVMTKGVAAKYGLKIGDTVSEEFLKGIGIRIPTQSHHSMLPFKVVDFLPDYMGDSVIVPDDVVTLAGSDFDVDKLYAYMKAIYSKGGKLKYYGEAITDIERYKEYVQWNKENNKDFKIQLKNKLLNDVEYQSIEEDITNIKNDLKELQKESDNVEEQLYDILEKFAEENEIDVDDIDIDDLSKKERKKYDKLESKANSKEESITELKNILKQALKDKGIHTSILSQEVLSSLGLYNKQSFIKDKSLKNNGAHMNDILKSWDEILKHPSLEESLNTSASRTKITEQVEPFYYNVLNSEEYFVAHTPNGMNKAYVNNTEAKNLVGVHANGNVINAYLAKNNVILNNPITFNGQQFDGFGGWNRGYKGADSQILYSNENGTLVPLMFRTDDQSKWYSIPANQSRIADELSTYVSAATDNAKNLDLVKLKHYQFNASIYSTGVSLGLGLVNMSILANTPVIEKLAQQINTNTSYISEDTLPTDVLISKYETTLRSVVDPNYVTKPVTTANLLYSIKLSQQKDLTSDESKIKHELNLDIFTLYKELSDISRQTIKVGSVLSANKKINSDFDTFKKIINNYDELVQNQVFDVTNLLGNNGTDGITINLINNLKNTLSQSGEIFISENTYVQKVNADLKSELKRNLNKIDKNLLKQLDRDFSRFLMLKAYEKSLKDFHPKFAKETITSFSSHLLVEGERNIVNVLRELSKNPLFRANPFVKIIKSIDAKDTNSGYPELEAVFNTSSPEMIEQLINASKALLNFNRTDVNTKKYSQFIADLFRYVLVKDGLGYKFNSLAPYIHPDMYQKYANATRDFLRFIGNASPTIVERNIDTYFNEPGIAEKFKKEYQTLTSQNVKYNNILPLSTKNQNTNKKGSAIKASIVDNTMIFKHPSLTLTPEEFNASKDKGQFTFNYSLDKKTNLYILEPQSYLKAQVSESTPYKIYKKNENKSNDVTTVYEEVPMIGNLYVAPYTLSYDFWKTQFVVSKTKGVIKQETPVNKEESSENTIISPIAKSTSQKQNTSEFYSPEEVEAMGVDELSELSEFKQYIEENQFPEGFNVIEYFKKCKIHNIKRK